ncbi:TPA: hypothetical protein QDB05_004338 [Burkholderia vietnamiensis]|uniref:hypothetical protein n=1 Tax=Burkholderia vietnamiensis TaxID=60552 RepID=UPI0012D93C80|nr:hypothetical protein [Burkholderia vietnamiensis]HDR9157809.1 hypothetical protein [Burkholderia vietnamiensis]
MMSASVPHCGFSPSHSLHAPRQPLAGDLSAIFIRSRRNDEINRQLVEFIGRFASFFVLELILRVPKLCSWLDAVHEHQTHHQEISA